MKTVALSTDHLLYRDPSIGMLDIFCELYPEARAFTLAHKVGAILGHLELRSIESTGLSKKSETLDQLMHKSFLIPTLAEQLRIPCSIDIMFNLSRGLSHSFRKCESTKLISYFYDDLLLSRSPASFSERFFRSYLKNWSRKGLGQVDLLMIPHEAFKAQLEPYVKSRIEVVPPFFKLSDFPLIPSKIFKKDFYCIHATGLTLKEARSIIELFDQRKMRYRFIGEDEHLAELKRSLPADHFFGSRCAGELAPLLASSRGLIDFEMSFFPLQSLQGMAEGLRILYRQASPGAVFLETPYAKASSLSELGQDLDHIDKSFEQDEAQKIRAYVMDYHDLKFKGSLLRAMNSFSS